MITGDIRSFFEIKVTFFACWQASFLKRPFSEILASKKLLTTILESSICNQEFQWNIESSSIFSVDSEKALYIARTIGRLGSRAFQRLCDFSAEQKNPFTVNFEPIFL